MPDRVAVIETLAREIAESDFIDDYEVMDNYDSAEDFISEMEQTLWDEKRRKALIADFKGEVEDWETDDNDLVTKHVEIIRRMEEL